MGLKETCFQRTGYIPLEASQEPDMAGQFRSSVWDPVLIISQILTIQCVFYISLGTWISIMDYIGGTYRSLDQFFSFEVLQFKDFMGTHHVCLCVECPCRSRWTMVCGAENKAVLGLCCHSTSGPPHCLLDIQWHVSEYIGLVAVQCCECCDYDCAWRILVHEDRNESHSFECG